jgi:hypothetical protein
MEEVATAPLIKGKGHDFPMAIDGGAWLEAAVASGTAPLMVAQKRKRRRNIFLVQATELARLQRRSGRG